MGLLTIVCVLGVVPALSYSGFCFSQKRFWSETEFVDVAIDHLIGLTTHTLKTRVPDGINFKSVKVVKYRSIAEFRSLNPDCCAIVPHNSEVKYVSFCDQLLGRAAKSVSLVYTLNYFDDDGSVKSAPFKAEAIIGNCGSVFH